MLRIETKGGGRLGLEKGERLAGIGLLDAFERGLQFVIADQRAREAEALVDPNQIRRSEGVNPQARSLQDRAQIGDRRPLAVGAGDMDHRRYFFLGILQPRQHPVHAIEAEVDTLRVQRGQPRDHIAERILRSGSRRVHAWGAAGAVSGAMTICAGSDTSGAGFGVASSAGDLVRMRQSRANVGRRS